MRGNGTYSINRHVLYYLLHQPFRTWRPPTSARQSSTDPIGRFNHVQNMTPVKIRWQVVDM